jgi:hypothetical protein
MLVPLILAVLAASPAAALKPASCLHPATGSAPTSLDALRACQAKARAAAIAAAANKGTPLTSAQLDQFDDAQRAEARKFFSQPQIVANGGPETPDSKAATTSNPSGKLGGAAPADLARLDSKSQDPISSLATRLHAAAGDGSGGITPAMAADIQSTLMKTQGSISPDMQSLLDSVAHDGGKLTPDTMKKLQDAGREAKGQGLDLGIDPKVEDQLLNHDFESDKPAFKAAQPPDSM